MQFDWYQATIAAPPSTILDAAMADLPNAHEIVHEARGGAGYSNSAKILDRGGDTLAFMLHGSKTAAPNLRGTSHRAVPVSELIRRHWPDHAVSRVDVAEDMTEEGLFRRIETQMRTIARAHSIESGLAFVPDDLDKGMTYRVGAPSSATLVRLYEKGREMLSKGTCTVEDFDPHHVRIEIQCRPQKAAKKRFATLDPVEAWGSSKWTQHLAAAVMALDVERLNLRPRDATDWDRTQMHLVHQFGNHMMQGGLRLAETVDGLVDPRVEDRVDAYLARLRTDLIERERERDRRARFIDSVRGGGVSV